MTCLLVMTRKLVSLRQVLKIEPIEGADKIELAHIDGWQCIVSKGQFKKYDYGIFHEIDSMVPKNETYEFLKDFNSEDRYRIKTIKLKGTLSQGLFFYQSKSLKILIYLQYLILLNMT